MEPLPGAVIDNLSPLWRRSWHAVATSEEVTASPLQAWLLGEPWCLARVGREVVAFEDRCPHRLAPLSAGRICGDVLECGYHGWRFAASGRCTAVPALGEGAVLPPRAVATRPWAVAERYGLVWLAPDAPVCDLLGFDEWDDPRFTTVRSTLVRTPAGAAQLVDNFLDAAHFPFVHASTFGVDESSEVADRGIVRNGCNVETTFDTWYRNFDDPLVATGDHDAVQRQVLLKRTGVSLSVYLRLEFPVTGATIGILFTCTPETQETTRVYKLLARDDIGDDAGRLRAFVADEDRILAEDLAILELYRHRSVPLDRRVEVHTRADRLSLAWRSLLAEWATPLEVGRSDEVAEAVDARA
jgi:vanillate O-demethylase monooxygenase subunit